MDDNTIEEQIRRLAHAPVHRPSWSSLTERTKRVRRHRRLAKAGAVVGVAGLVLGVGAVVQVLSSGLDAPDSGTDQPLRPAASSPTSQSAPLQTPTTEPAASNDVTPTSISDLGVLPQSVDGWIRLEPQSAVEDLDPPGYVWIEAPGDPQAIIEGDPQAIIEYASETGGFPESFDAYDSPGGRMIGVYFPGEGFVPVSHLGQFTPGVRLLKEFPCLDGKPDEVNAADCISSVLGGGR